MVHNIQTGPSKSELNAIFHLYSNGKIDEAIEEIKALNELYPNVPLLFNILGACYKAIGRLENAAQMFKTAFAIKPDYAEAYYNHGLALKELNKNNAAIESYQNAISIQPNYPIAHNNLGLIFLEKKELNFAKKHFQMAIKYQLNFAEAHNNLGVTFQEQQMFDKSILEYSKAVSINPQYTQAFNNLGIVYQALGKTTKAIESYEKALKISPKFISAHYNLSRVKTFTLHDPQIQQLELLETSELNELEKINLTFALSKIHEDLNNHEKFFKYLNKGNQLTKKRHNYNINADLAKHQYLQKLFKNSKQLPKLDSKKYKDLILSKSPIFIVGMPRSGTTLVEQIISSHNKVYGADEMDSFSNIISSFLNEISTSNNQNISLESLLLIRKKYLSNLTSLGVSEKNITDKWPLNFQYLGFILLAFPEAKIVHLKRNPIATCWSIYKHFFSDIGNGWAYNLKDLSDYYNSYLNLIKFWHKLFPNKIYDICYEDLTTNQEVETKKLLKYCELDWDKKCLNFHSNKRAVKTASALQVRQKMYQGSSDEWKKYESYLQPLINGLQKK